MTILFIRKKKKTLVVYKHDHNIRVGPVEYATAEMIYLAGPADDSTILTLLNWKKQLIEEGRLDAQAKFLTERY